MFCLQIHNVLSILIMFLIGLMPSNNPVKKDLLSIGFTAIMSN